MDKIKVKMFFGRIFDFKGFVKDVASKNFDILNTIWMVNSRGEEIESSLSELRKDCVDIVVNNKQLKRVASKRYLTVMAKLFAGRQELVVMINSKLGKIIEGD